MPKIMPYAGGWYIMNDKEIAAEITAANFHLKYAKFKKSGRKLLHFGIGQKARSMDML